MAWTLRLRVDHRLRAADDKSLVTFEKIDHHFGKGLRPLSADRVPGVIDKDEMGIRDQLLVKIAHFRGDHGIEGAEQDERRRREIGSSFLEIYVAVWAPQPHDEGPVFAWIAGSGAGTVASRSGWA
jgi:hypothetical protein